MRRVLKPGGVILVLETLGTGRTSPEPPPHLRGYYALLDRRGFTSEWIRTDYRFRNDREAERLVTFFFGAEMVGRVTGRRLAECTGLWCWRDPDAGRATVATA